jgi:hypothetical protein
VAADQVIGATGVPVEGDPGWAAAAARAGHAARLPARRVRAPSAAPLASAGRRSGGAGRKHVRWRAEDVHHFAWSASPTTSTRAARYGDVAGPRALPARRHRWAGGVVVAGRTAALAFFDTIFGTYAWPQITNVHRIEGGGTEFPMLMMNGSPSVGLILHEVGHNYVHGILANNEWREAGSTRDSSRS